MTQLAKHPEFTYDFSPLNDIQVEMNTDARTGKEVVSGVIIKDEPLQPSQRFWTSLFSLYGFNKRFFTYFSHEEVFERISSVRSSDQLRVCVERGEDKNGVPVNRLLAVSNPKKPIVPFDDLMEMLERSEHHGLSYYDGILQSTHRPRVGAAEFDVMGDTFMNRFMMASPVDGYGLPNVYLSMLREECANGMIAMSKLFRSTVALGKGDDNVAFALTRVLDQFSNDEGYAALRQRLESGAMSWASVNESTSLYKLLVRLHNERDHTGSPVLASDGVALSASPLMRKALANDTVDSPMGEDSDVIGSPIIKAFHGMTGDVSRLYGLANLDALSAKRQRSLPVNTTVYDMINFATEVATHHSTPAAFTRLQSWVGTLIGQEYDMEGTKEQYGSFADFHIGAKLEQGVTGSENTTAA